MVWSVILFYAAIDVDFGLIFAQKTRYRLSEGFTSDVRALSYMAKLTAVFVFFYSLIRIIKTIRDNRKAKRK